MTIVLFQSSCAQRYEFGVCQTFCFVVFCSTGNVVGVSPNLNSKLLTSSLSCNVLNPGKMIHSNSIGSPSILWKFLYSGEVLNHSQSLFHASFDWGFSRIFPWHNTESEKTQTFVRWRLMTLSSPINDRYFHEWFSQPTVSNPEISFCSDTSFVDMSNICLSVRPNCVCDGLTIVQVILSHEYCWLHCYSHEHSPNQRMFLSIFCNIWNSFLSFSHLIIHPIPNDLDSADNSNSASSFQWRIVEAMLLLENRYRVALVCHEALPHSQRIARFHHERFPRERNQVEFLVSLSKKFHRVAPIARTSQYQFPLLRRPSTVVIPLWVACWREAFHELLLIIVIGSFHSVYAENGSPWSLLFFSNCTPRILISITSLHRVNEVEDDTTDGILALRFIIGFDFAVTRSSPDPCCSLFVIAAEQTVELKWLMLNKHNKWFHSSRVKFSFG